jgi:microcystin-dependent protein
MSIPANIIIIWSGLQNQLPEGWILCNGQNNTPDLRNRFVIGGGNNYSLNSTGGNKDAVLLPHTHTTTVSAVGNHGHNVIGNTAGSPGPGSPGGGVFLGINNRQFTGTATSSSNGAHTHSVSISNTGSSAINANLPPYYALAFIMKEED